MLKTITRKLFILFVLCAALTAVSAGPAGPTKFCYEVPICAYDCCSGYYCCDRWGNCTCG